MQETEFIQGFRLSPQQSRLWSLQQESRVYTAQCATRLEGSIQPDELRRALLTIIDRHEILRTVYYRHPGIKIPVQVVLDSLAPSWHCVDLGGMNAELQLKKVEEIIEEEKNYPFDFEHGPLLRSALITLSSREALLALTLPSLCADAHTLKNLVYEISRCCVTPAQQQGPDDDTLQYIQFAEWQNDLLDNDENDSAKQHWDNLTSVARSGLKLPLERKSSGDNHFDPATVVLNLSSDAADRAGTIAQKYHTSLAVVLLACWQGLLYRLTGQADIAVACLVDGRKHDILNGAFGLLAKLAPVGCHFEESPTFSQILRQVDKGVANAIAWQEYFAWDDSLQTSQDELQQAFPPVAFCFQEPLTKFSTGGVSFSPYKQCAYIDRFNMQLSCNLFDSSIAAEFHYDSSRFGRRDVEQIALSFSTLLNQALRYPEAPIDELNVISEADRHRLLVDFNQTAFDYPDDKCLHQLFEEQVEAAPDKTAVAFAEQRVSYAELDARANRLAHLLRRLGAGPDRLVGLCTERSIDMIVGLLGILKSGSAYLPLDPEQPKARLAHMVEETQAALLVTQHEMLERLPDFHGRIICIDKDQPEFYNEPATRPSSINVPENLVYVIYTSGSTGVPKGVAVSHRSVVNYATFLCDRLGLKNSTSFATVSTISADLGNTCILPALISGGCIHVLSYDVATDPTLFADYISKNRVDVLKIVPSHLSSLLPGTAIKDVLPREHLILGGEALSLDLAKRLLDQSGDCKVTNHYGPTESTVGSLVLRQGEEDDYYDITSTVPIGRPISNTEVYILDSKLRPVPIGVAGEIYIGGAGLARCYINQPGQTAERFMPNQFSQSPGARLYKTGDMARYLTDGKVEFLGRADHQVKIRGLRIELQEVQAAMSKFPGLRDVVIQPREDQPGQLRLVAYLCMGQNLKPNVTDLRNFLSKTLPEYMIPSAFVFLDSLPLSANGKVDRNALPAPDQVRPELAKGFVAPHTSIEELLAGIWIELLDLERVGIYDDFFELGGHSLLVTRLTSRIRQVFEVELPLQQVFRASTIAELAESIETALRAKEEFRAPPILPAPRDQQLPLSFAQERLWFLDHMEPGSGFYNCPAAVRIEGPLNIAGLDHALGQIVQRHEVLRTVFETVDGQPVQVIVPAQPISMALVDLSNLTRTWQEAQAARLAAEEAQRPFDLSRDAMLRAALLRLGHEEHLLLFTMHHIVSDGWSRSILIREMVTLYDAFSKGEPSPLAAPSIQYADFAVWQRQYLQGGVFQEHLSYWKKQLGGDLPTLRIPTDRPRPSLPSFRGASQFLPLSEGLTQDLRALSHREGTTLFMTLLAAFSTLLYRYSGQQDIIVGTAIAGRNQRETEELIGFFVNMLALRIDLSGNPTFRDLLSRVREVALGAYTHQDLPFEKLVEQLQLKRDANRHPLFQVVFALNNAPKPMVELSDLKLKVEGGDGGTARFDLTFNMIESPDQLINAIDYSMDLFDAATISRMLEHFRNLLEAVVVHPDWNLLDFSLAAEKQDTTTESPHLYRGYEADNFTF